MCWKKLIVQDTKIHCLLMLFMRFPDTFSEVIEEKYFMLPQIPKDFDSDLV